MGYNSSNVEPASTGDRAAEVSCEFPWRRRVCTRSVVVDTCAYDGVLVRLHCDRSAPLAQVFASLCGGYTRHRDPHLCLSGAYGLCRFRPLLNI